MGQTSICAEFLLLLSQFAFWLCAKLVLVAVMFSFFVWRVDGPHGCGGCLWRAVSLLLWPDFAASSHVADSCQRQERSCHEIDRKPSFTKRIGSMT